MAELTRYIFHNKKITAHKNKDNTYQDTAAKFGSPQHSPLYTPPTGAEPVSFKKGDKCEWRILATHGEKIVLNITSLDIPASANCHLDYLEVRWQYLDNGRIYL